VVDTFDDGITPDRAADRFYRQTMTNHFKVDITKSDLRRQALARRDALDTATRIDASLHIASHHSDFTVNADDIVSGFWPIRSEIDPRALMFELGKRASALCLPVTIDRTTIVFRRLERTAPLVKTGFGTIGPDSDAPVLDPTIMLVPLAAFDARGHRIGYGAGYYDRAIAKLTALRQRPQLVGVAFDCQHIDHVPEEPHDIALDAVLTETGFHVFQ